MSSALPSFWLPQPEFEVSLADQIGMENLYRRFVEPARGAWISDEIPVPKWVFLRWLGEQKNLLFHGSGNPDIVEFQPRKPVDFSPDEFSKQAAVFATDDGIWPILYAVLDRALPGVRLLNAALEFEENSARTGRRYFFSVAEEALRRDPWHKGTVYLVPRAGFVCQPPYVVAGRLAHDPHWASLAPVRPWARLAVEPADFPFLAQVRSHDPGEIAIKSQQNPSEFPWL